MATQTPTPPQDADAQSPNAPPNPRFKTYLSYLTHLSTLPSNRGLYTSLISHLHLYPARSYHPLTPLVGTSLRYHTNNLITCTQLTVPKDYELWITQTPHDLEDQILILDEAFVNWPAGFVDVLGLGLDVSPAVWRDLLSNSRRSASPSWPGEGDRHIVLDHGTLLLLDGVPGPGGRPKTAIMFLKLLHPTDNMVFPAQLPSEAAWEVPALYSSVSHPTILEFIRYTETFASGRSCFGSGNFLLICLQYLLAASRSTPPNNIIVSSALNGPFFYRYYRDIMELPVDPHAMWIKLRSQIERTQNTLLFLPDFISQHFTNTQTNPFLAAYKQMQHKHEVYIRRLEIHEQRLRDQIEIISSTKSAQMAEISIQESRRVILLTILAFIFLPISLTGTLFGMNIRQINATGHSISAFIITTILLLLSSLVIWISISALAWYRRTRIAHHKKIVISGAKRYTRMDRLLMVDEGLDEKVSRWLKLE